MCFDVCNYVLAPLPHHIYHILPLPIDIQIPLRVYMYKIDGPPMRQSRFLPRDLHFAFFDMTHLRS